jgi:hypothetical protein
MTRAERILIQNQARKWKEIPGARKEQQIVAASLAVDFI